MLSVIPDDVRRFLLAAVPTVPHLEALLLLHAAPQARWSGAKVADRLYVDHALAGRLLEDLAAAGVVADTPDGWTYQPRDAEMGAVINDVATTYARHVVAVAELIHSSTERKAQRFADAFHLRKKP